MMSSRPSCAASGCLRVVALVAAAWLWSFAALAAAPTASVVDDLMRKSGLWEQLAAIGPQLEQGVGDASARSGHADAPGLPAVRRAFAVAYGPDRLRPAMAKALLQEISAEDAAAALAWLDTDLGRRITKLEEETSRAGEPDRPADIVAALPPDRRALYERLARATHAGEVGAMIAINVAYGVARGMHLAARGNPGPDPEAVRAELQAMRPKLVVMMAEQSLAASALTYATLSDADLARYVEFAESPAGRRYHAATSLALDRALSAASVEAGRLAVSGQTT